MINAFISLVLVNKNGQESLLSAVDSLFNQLSSISSQFELIVIDNGSSDESVHLLEKLSLNKKYMNNCLRKTNNLLEKWLILEILL